MLRIRKREDYILLVLIVAIILTTLLLFFKNNDFNTEDSIQIKRSSAREEVLSKEDRVESKRSYHKKESNKTNDLMVVQLGGAVQNPGVYKCQAGERIYQLLEKAGGVSANANLDSINLVDEVKDGQKVIIPSNKSNEIATNFAASKVANRVNINTASKEGLQRIKGVGPSTAEKIIEYRKQQGSFSSIEELANVPGIGPKTLEKLKSQIAY